MVVRMTPTPKLRFVERLVPMPEHGGYLKTIRILQQWWEPEYNIIDMVVDKKTGEWRDVPIEKE
jgi:hypothetical protein